MTRSLVVTLASRVPVVVFFVFFVFFIPVVVITGGCSDPPALPARTDVRLEASTPVDSFGRPQTPSVPKAIAPDAQRDLVVLGSLNKLQIADVLRANIVHVTNCANASAPPAKGIVVVKMVIGADGRITQAQAVESSMGRSDVEDCITGAAKTWSFPEPMGGGIVVATVPFRLE